MQFWFLIGAAEVCTAWSSSKDPAPDRFHYLLNKLFLGIWRDLGIVLGHRLGSYWETLVFASQRLSSDICAASYALKLGNESRVPWSKIRYAHESAIFSDVRSFIQSNRDYDNIRDLYRKLIGLETGASGCLAVEALKYAKGFESNFSARKAACERLIQKLTR